VDPYQARPAFARCPRRVRRGGYPRGLSLFDLERQCLAPVGHVAGKRTPARSPRGRRQQDRVWRRPTPEYPFEAVARSLHSWRRQVDGLPPPYVSRESEPEHCGLRPGRLTLPLPMFHVNHSRLLVGPRRVIVVASARGRVGSQGPSSAGGAGTERAGAIIHRAMVNGVSASLEIAMRRKLAACKSAVRTSFRRRLPDGR
jgi:hypothetical protein